MIVFKAKIDLMMQVQRGKKTANKEQQKAERLKKQQSWNHSIKRVQRYLGIRQTSVENQKDAIRTGLQDLDLQWQDYDATVKNTESKLMQQEGLNIDMPAPYTQEGSVVFVCIDVEAYERNTRQITEIGIATLDTKDIASMSPGEGGVNWRKLIRARHFRINEYKHLRNNEFVDGCPDRFAFGYF
jgi:hypothetical protein